MIQTIESDAKDVHEGRKVYVSIDRSIFGRRWFEY